MNNNILNFIKKYNILILIIIGILLYFSSLFYDFIYDDFPFILENKNLNISSIDFFNFFVLSFCKCSFLYIIFSNSLLFVKKDNKQ